MLKKTTALTIPQYNKLIWEQLFKAGKELLHSYEKRITKLPLNILMTVEN